MWGYAFHSSSFQLENVILIKIGCINFEHFLFLVLVTMPTGYTAFPLDCSV